jgi:hypothetical protein
MDCKPSWRRVLMAEQSAAWTGPWVAQRLVGKAGIQDVELLAPQVLRIVRNHYQPFLAGIIAAPRVDTASVLHILQPTYPIEIITNVPRESFWTGEAISLASQNSVAFGGVGDLISAVSTPDVRHYVNREFAFVERIFRQHSRVTTFKRAHDRKYVIQRAGLDDVNLVILNEYELTADHVRTARDRYDAFTAILLTNPNARPTYSAHQAADSIGAAIFNLSHFLGWLNNP